MAMTRRGELRGAARTRVGTRGRAEDRFLLRISRREGARALAAVADGMGGHGGGGSAAEVALAVLERHWRELEEAAPGGVSARLAHLHDEMRADIASLRRRGIATERAGTTLTAFMATNDQAWIHHIGDSRCWHLRGGEGRLLTEDHNIAWRLHREGSLSREERDESPFRHRLYRFLGRDDARPDWMQIPLEAGDGLLLVTDGSSLSRPDVEALTPPYNPEAMLDAALPEGLSLGDDATAVALVVD